ncbi:hypothetical protein ALT1644_100023 [Alteromonas macleodii]
MCNRTRGKNNVFALSHYLISGIETNYVSGLFSLHRYAVFTYAEYGFLLCACATQ